MNDHLKEQIAKVKTDTSGRWVSINELEVFAELIIKKCVVVGNYAYDGGEYPGPMIKEYFGVE